MSSGDRTCLHPLMVSTVPTETARRPSVILVLGSSFLQLFFREAMCSCFKSLKITEYLFELSKETEKTHGFHKRMTLV